MSKSIKAFDAAVKKGYTGTREEFKEAYEEEESEKLLNKINAVGAKLSVIVFFSAILSVLWLWSGTLLMELYSKAVPYTFGPEMVGILFLAISCSYYIVTFAHEIATSDE